MSKSQSLETNEKILLGDDKTMAFQLPTQMDDQKTTHDTGVHVD